LICNIRLRASKNLSCNQENASQKFMNTFPLTTSAFVFQKKNAKWQTDHQASPFFNRTNGTNEHCPTPQGHNRQNILFLNMCMKITKNGVVVSSIGAKFIQVN